MRLLFYVSSGGRRYVEDFISGLEDRLQAAVVVALDQIRVLGIGAPGVSFRQIKGKLWEIRVQAGGAARLFYVIRAPEDREQELILLHAYLKQTQKAPKREIAVAISRMKEILG